MGRLEDLEKRQSILVEFGRRVSSENRLDPLLLLLADEVRKLLDADRCSVFLVDVEKKELWSKVALGMAGKVIRVPMDHGLVGFVARTGEIVNIPDAYKDARFKQETDRLTGYKTKTILAVPLKNREGKIVGVFEVLNKVKRVFDREDVGFLQILAALAASAVENARLYESLRKSYLDTIYRLGLVSEFHDPYDTALHLKRMSRYCCLLSEMLGFPGDKVEEMRYASPLHDIGKVIIPDAILRKPGPLTTEEFEEMKKHTTYGAKILANSTDPFMQAAHIIALTHHERYDGTGYPRGLKGEDIPLESRIVAVADVFDALTTKRVYKPAWAPGAALKHIQEKSGSQFDPHIVDVFSQQFPLVLAIFDELSASS